MSVSFNQNSYYPVNTEQKKPVQNPAAKASFKGSPEQEEKEGMSTTAKAALVTAGLALATVGAIYGCKAYKKMNLEKPLKELIGKADDLAGMDRSALEELKKKIESAIDTAKKGGLSDDNAQVKSLREKLSKIEEKLNSLAPQPKPAPKPPITSSADAIDALRKDAQDLVQKYADVAQLTNESDAKEALSKIEAQIKKLNGEKIVDPNDADLKALTDKKDAIEQHIAKTFPTVFLKRQNKLVSD